MLIKLQKNQHAEIVVGGNLLALLYSYMNHLPIIINKLNPPHRFEEQAASNSLKTWNQLFFILSLDGLNLMGDKASSVRIKEEEIVVTTKDARVIKFSYDQITIFDDENVIGIPVPKKENDKFIVLDWITTRSCSAHTHKYIKTNDALVNELHFYPTERIDGAHLHVKDIVAVSNLTKKQLQDFEYSDTYAKFKTASILKDLGLRGIKCGGGKSRALALEVEKREIRKAKMDFYENLPKIKFKYDIHNDDMINKKINDLFKADA